MKKALRKQVELFLLFGDLTLLTENDQNFCTHLSALFKRNGELDKGARDNLIKAITHKGQAYLSQIPDEIELIRQQIQRASYEQAWHNFLLIIPKYLELFDASTPSSVAPLYDLFSRLVVGLDLKEKETLFDRVVRPLRAIASPSEKRIQLEKDLAYWFSLRAQNVSALECYRRALFLAERHNSPQLDDLYKHASSFLVKSLFKYISSFERLIENTLKQKNQKLLELQLQQLAMIRNSLCQTIEAREHLVPLYSKMLPYFSGLNPPSKFNNLILEGQLPSQGKFPEPYVKRARNALQTWKTLFNSKGLLTTFLDLFPQNKEECGSLLLAVLGGSLVKESESPQPYLSPVTLFELFCDRQFNDASKQRITLLQFAFQKISYCEEQEAIKHYFPLVEAAVSYLLGANAPDEEHIKLYGHLSTKAFLETLRRLFLSFNNRV